MKVGQSLGSLGHGFRPFRKVLLVAWYLIMMNIMMPNIMDAKMVVMILVSILQTRKYLLHRWYFLW